MAVAFVTAAIVISRSTPSPSEVELASVLTLVGLAMGALSFTVTKVAVVILLIHLLHPSPCHVRILWALVGGNVFFMVVTGFSCFLQCTPPQGLWNPEIERSCWNPVIATSLETTASGKTVFPFRYPLTWYLVRRLTHMFPFCLSNFVDI